jgi:small subunit ribosomal protein S17
MTTSSPTTTTTKTEAQRRHLQGVVVSANMAKTVVIRIDRSVMHPKYGKYYTVSKKLKVHDEEGKAHVGDTIEIEETRPLSREKRFRYLSTVKSSNA